MGERTNYTPGTFSWTDLTTTDQDAAKMFYSSLFGWETQEVDGNDIAAIVAALRHARLRQAKPKAIVLRTLPGKGVPTLEEREKAHFVRVDEGEWDGLFAEFERGVANG